MSEIEYDDWFFIASHKYSYSVQKVKIPKRILDVNFIVKISTGEIFWHDKKVFRTKEKAIVELEIRKQQQIDFLTKSIDNYIRLANETKNELRKFKSNMNKGKQF